jgi:hypothetical protein
MGGYAETLCKATGMRAAGNGDVLRKFASMRRILAQNIEKAHARCYIGGVTYP